VLHRIAWLLAKLLYRLRIFGLEHLPASGPALIVSNHVSYVDWLFLMAASPRPIRFVVAKNFFSKPIVGWWLRRVRAIPLARRFGPKSLMESLHEVEAALKAGEVVCVFPEGYPSRNGNLLPFRRGFEQIAQSTALAIVPVYLDQVWGSIFSYKHSKLFWKWPGRGPYPVSITFGSPLPNNTPAPRVRQVIQELAADAAKERTTHCLPMHRQFVRMAARHPFRPCLIDNIGTLGDLTYGKALAGAVVLSRWLRPRVHDADMVGLWMPATPGAALANVALALLGKTAVNLNYTAGQESVRSAIRQCGIKHVLTSRKFLDRVALDPGPGVEWVFGEDSRAQISNLSRVRAFIGILLFPGWLLDWLLGLGGHKPSDLATVIFSSGSTGEPKGVALTYQNVTSNIEIFKDAVDYSPRDRVLGILPFFHSFGFTVTLWGALVAGAVAVHHADPRAAREIGELCRTHRCTLMAATATFLRLYLRRCGQDDFKTMRLLVCGAEKLPPALVEEFRAKFGITALEGYGCTELSPVISVNVPDVTVNNLTQIGTKIGAVGQPLPGIAVRIVDADRPDSIAPLPIGQEGQVLVTGPNVMRGYLGRDDLNRKKLLSGWYLTGDMARVDEDGFITLTGRLEQFAKIGGEMVPLELLDETLHKTLGNADRVLALTAVPDPKRGERIVVLYLPSLAMPIGDLLSKLTAAGIPNLWIPDERDCFEVPELPVLGSGKLNLRKVKEMAVELVNRKNQP
jgi:acyl-[acyl-carrier-protein]-phospholipid O-acyltransferase / long-chain-fatty-acid--[acyl-carrier-protein] ligase